MNQIIWCGFILFIVFGIFVRTTNETSEKPFFFFFFLKSLVILYFSFHSTWQFWWYFIIIMCTMNDIFFYHIIYSALQFFFLLGEYTKCNRNKSKSWLISHTKITLIICIYFLYNSSRPSGSTSKNHYIFTEHYGRHI